MARHRKVYRKTAAAMSAGVAATALLAATGTVASAVTPPNIQELLDTGVISDGTRADNTEDWFTGFPAIVVLTPGTDDGSFLERTAGISGTRLTYVVQYPESVGPIISGKSGKLLPFFAPSYDKSKQVAIDGNLSVMRALHANPAGVVVIYSGYSQGAEALGDAAEQGYAEGLLDGNTLILLVSDPRSPWGLKQWVADQPLLPFVFKMFGAESNGARDPGATGTLLVNSVILTGDPVANWQWKTYRPLSSLAVNAAGFLTVHSGRGPQHYGNLFEFGPATTYTSADGNTVYTVFETAHPFALLTAAIYDELGIEYTDDDLAEWDAVWQKFYEIEKPKPGNAAVPVNDPAAPLLPATSGYSVSVPSEAATGSQPAVAEPTVTPNVPVTATPSQDEESNPVPSQDTPEPAAPVVSEQPSVDTPVVEATPSEEPTVSSAPEPDTSSEVPVPSTSSDSEPATTS